MASIAILTKPEGSFTDHLLQKETRRKIRWLILGAFTKRCGIFHGHDILGVLQSPRKMIVPVPAGDVLRTEFPKSDDHKN